MAKNRASSPATDQQADATPGTAAFKPNPEAVIVDVNQPHIQTAISQGKALVTEGKSKAEAAHVIFAVLHGEPKEVVVAAFVEGADLTPKGALTYWYNCRRKVAKAAKASA